MAAPEGWEKPNVGSQENPRPMWPEYVGDPEDGSMYVVSEFLPRRECATVGIESGDYLDIPFHIKNGENFEVLDWFISLSDGSTDAGVSIEFIGLDGSSKNTQSVDSAVGTNTTSPVASDSVGYDSRGKVILRVRNDSVTAYTAPGAGGSGVLIEYGIKYRVV